MVTTRSNHDGQPANQEGNSSAVLVEMRRELEVMRKLREEDRLQREEERLRQTGAHNALREENERLRQRLERIEKAQHSRNVHAEGDSSRPAEQPQPDRERNEPQRERQVEVSRQDDQDATSQHVEDSTDHQFPLPTRFWQLSCRLTGIITRWTSTMALRTRTSTSIRTSPS